MEAIVGGVPQAARDAKAASRPRRTVTGARRNKEERITNNKMKRLSILLLVVVAAAVAIWYVPLQAAVRPPKLAYQRLVLPNGMVVILHQDKSTPIVHA